MTRTVSASDAQAKLGAILRWAEKNRDGVIIERRGKPAGVLIAYEEYEELDQLRSRQKKLQALKALRQLRQEIQAQNQDLTSEEAYRMAGFSEEVIRETLQMDEQFSANEEK